MRLSVTLGLATVVAALLSAQTPFSDGVRAFIKVDAPVAALTNVRVIDGTGAPARANQTIIIRNGNIEALGEADDRMIAMGTGRKDIKSI